MLFEKKDIEKELVEFVSSDQFANLKVILEDYALNKFYDMQKNKKDLPEMLADKAILNFYMGFATYLENKTKAIERRKQAEITEKINKAQEELE